MFNHKMPNIIETYTVLSVFFEGRRHGHMYSQEERTLHQHEYYATIGETLAKEECPGEISEKDRPSFIIAFSAGFVSSATAYRPGTPLSKEYLARAKNLQDMSRVA